MITLCYHKNFLVSAKRLPEEHLDKLVRLLIVLQENPFQPLLHTKRLSGPLAGFFSFRITRDWRVIFQFNDPKTIQLLRIRHRKDAYR
ncbi:MAG: type II toxin-antitoxin system RelE/ParE family toxin [bacterium]|nr:type II toxin-antitoxin system RelE/ParE family toxin [bacterium]MDZ4285984.1 type II toxin-antitoxin system RelE/ParE family toxin [Candidatus Sungbacteria bacterium]